MILAARLRCVPLLMYVVFLVFSRGNYSRLSCVHGSTKIKWKKSVRIHIPGYIFVDGGDGIGPVADLRCIMYFAPVLFWYFSFSVYVGIVLILSCFWRRGHCFCGEFSADFLWKCFRLLDAPVASSKYFACGHHYYYYFSCHLTMCSVVSNFGPSWSLRKKKATDTKGALCTKSNSFLYLLPARARSTPFGVLSPYFSLLIGSYFYSKS